jgi:hypothetical protein
VVKGATLAASVYVQAAKPTETPATVRRPAEPSKRSNVVLLSFFISVTLLSLEPKRIS